MDHRKRRDRYGHAVFLRPGRILQQKLQERREHPQLSADPFIGHGIVLCTALSEGK